MNILVTGAAGFIGSHVAERLIDLRHNVTGLDNYSDYYEVQLKKKNANSLKAKGVNIITGDLRDSNLSLILPETIEYIFHFAAHPGISSSSTYEDYYSNNVLGTKNLLGYASKLPNLKMFVYISTSSVYGLEATFAENHQLNPASHYGRTKLEAEKIVLEAVMKDEIRACSLRLYSVIGPRERPDKMYTKLIKCGLNHESFPLFEESEKHYRSFTYVGDIVDGVVSVIGKEKVVNGEVFNLGSEKEYTTKEGIETVEKVLGYKIKIKLLPKRAGDQLRTKAVIDKARRMLGYNPRTTLMQSVEAQVAWYKTNFL
jgi:nucleoside-diphosphate-sugar epimerase